MTTGRINQVSYIVNRPCGGTTGLPRWQLHKAVTIQSKEFTADLHPHPIETGLLFVLVCKHHQSTFAGTWVTDQRS